MPLGTAPPEHRRPRRLRGSTGWRGHVIRGHVILGPTPAPAGPGLESALAKPGAASPPRGSLGWTSLAVTNHLWTAGRLLGQAGRSFSLGTSPPYRDVGKSEWQGCLCPVAWFWVGTRGHNAPHNRTEAREVTATVPTRTYSSPKAPGFRTGWDWPQSGKAWVPTMSQPKQLTKQGETPTPSSLCSLPDPARAPASSPSL